MISASVANLRCACADLLDRYRWYCRKTAL